ncbi:MAG TPA: DUF1566 domain-containing protein [bacterium]|nr:DUF1566 domain-containing protein [bacterium]HPS29054.1 DUF1566 domain-containing protein [bacterium]
MKKVLNLMMTVSLLGSLLTACGGEEADNTVNDSDTAAADNEILSDDEASDGCPASDKFCHEQNGLKWTDISSEKIVWSKAKENCASLGGRLPTIAELRGLVDGCDKTKTGGSCQFTEGCLSNDCIADCFCTTTVDGYSVFGDIEWLWSSSSKDGDTESACGVAFNNASIFCDSQTGWNYYRCVK